MAYELSVNYLSKSLHIPVELFYTKNHEWLAVDENVVTFGITEKASQFLGEILYIDLPDEGDRINIGSMFASLEGVRNIMDLIAPFSGTILEVNPRLIEDPALISDDTYGEGWLFTAELDSEKDLALLVRHLEYKQQLLSQEL
ncbi:glycine cleavage system protein H [Bdellovibrio sp. qaytius]|nr:glycine cleavage system protein H [Bdellovibrio sp. qaytius]